MAWRVVPDDGGPDGVHTTWISSTATVSPPVLRLRGDARYDLVLRVWTDDRSLRAARVTDFTPSTAPLVLRVERGREVSGRVVRSDGTPVVGARVRVPGD